MVIGPARACTIASAMASRTPKHMPKCSARMMRIQNLVSIVAAIPCTLYHKVNGDDKHFADGSSRVTNLTETAVASRFLPVTERVGSRRILKLDEAKSQIL